MFLRGLTHVQMEPIWGGRQDSAATLRGTCALALVDCAIDTFELLTILTGLVNDGEAAVRIDAIRAMAQVSARESVLPLRLKALVGDREPEVVGQCFAALLSLDPGPSLAFVAGFLRSATPEMQMEAAGALAECREPRGIELLAEFWQSLAEPELRRVLLRLLGSSPLPEAAGLLVSVLEEASGETAAEALTALSKSRYRPQVQPRVTAVVAAKQDPALTRLYEQAFGSA